MFKNNFQKNKFYSFKQFKNKNYFKIDFQVQNLN